MKRLQSSYLLILIVTTLISSCVSKKDIVYFQNDKIDQTKVNNSYKTIIKPDDLLLISVTAKDLKAVKPFNLPVVTFSINTDRAIGNPIQQSYLVDNKGDIDFPILGKISVAGLTRNQAIAKIKALLDPAYVKAPKVNIRFLNFKITVLGDVRNPGSFTFPNERVTLLDAIGYAGDLNLSAERKKVIVIREEGDKKNKYVVDLLSNKVFTSPVYYLQQNDIIYVEHNNAKTQSAARNQNSGLFISIAGIIISIITIISK